MNEKEMKLVEVLKNFNDKVAGVDRKAGDEFECDIDRAIYLSDCVIDGVRYNLVKIKEDEVVTSTGETKEEITGEGKEDKEEEETPKADEETPEDKEDAEAPNGDVEAPEDKEEGKEDISRENKEEKTTEAPKKRGGRTPKADKAE